MWGFSNIACCSSDILENVYKAPFLLQNILETTLNDADPNVILKAIFFKYLKKK